MAACNVDGGGGGDDFDDDDDARVFSLKSASIILSFTANNFSSVGTSRPFESFCKYQGNWTTDAAGCITHGGHEHDCVLMTLTRDHHLDCVRQRGVRYSFLHKNVQVALRSSEL